VNVNFAAYPLGISDPVRTGQISAAYPNPAVSTVSFDYDIADGGFGSIIIRNILGTVVKESQLSSPAGKLIFDVTDLANGIYFYSLVVNGNRTVTGKMVVKH